MTSHVWSWGWEKEGCLGTETLSTTDSDDSEFAKHPRPVLLQKVVFISSGNSHVLALTVDGEIFSWGRTASGRLGYVTGQEHQFTPLPIFSNHKFSKIACGSHHSLAITTSGQIATWGSGFSGQCGHGNRLDIEKPSIISSLGATKFVKVSGGYHHSLALDDEGNIWVWGTGKQGQLGLGKNLVHTSVPVMLKVDKKKFSNIAAGEFNSFATTTGGEMFIWGGNRFGILGNGFVGVADPAWTPQPLFCRNGIQFKHLAFGTYFAVAISLSGKLYYWGRTMDMHIIMEPTPYRTPSTDEVIFAQVATRGSHVLCATDGGEVYVLGFGEYGQLGLEGTTSALELVKIKNLNGVTDIAVGNYHSVAITSMVTNELVNFLNSPLRRMSINRSDSDLKRFDYSRRKSNPRTRRNDKMTNSNDQNSIDGGALLESDLPEIEEKSQG